MGTCPPRGPGGPNPHKFSVTRARRLFLLDVCHWLNVQDRWMETSSDPRKPGLTDLESEEPRTADVQAVKTAFKGLKDGDEAGCCRKFSVLQTFSGPEAADEAHQTFLELFSTQQVPVLVGCIKLQPSLSIDAETLCQVSTGVYGITGTVWKSVF